MAEQTKREVKVPNWVSVTDRLPDAPIEIFYEEGGRVFHSDPKVVVGYRDSVELVLDVAIFHLDEDVEGGYWLETMCSEDIDVIWWLDNLPPAQCNEPPKEG